MGQVPLMSASSILKGVRFPKQKGSKDILKRVLIHYKIALRAAEIHRTLNPKPPPIPASSSNMTNLSRCWSHTTTAKTFAERCQCLELQLAHVDLGCTVFKGILERYTVLTLTPRR